MSRYLDMIDSPRDLRKLHPNQLEELADEIREIIIRTVSQSGGHLSSNLGAVELTLAVHYVFDAPNDKIVWDVSHQGYAHKLITGRRDSFKSLRKYKGLSGFLNPAESEFDAFAAGHASTSISAAVGMAVARDLRESNEKVVAIIGDGALSGGMAFEALNHAGPRIKNFIVILNDNEMSISHNVGALAAYLNRIITMPIYNKVVEEVDNIVKKLPFIGTRMIRTRRKILESIKSLVVPGVIFEELGYRYFGPVNGNDLHALLHILRSIKNQTEPIFLHVITQKGKGFGPAVERPEDFHSAKPFEIKTGKSKVENKNSTFTEVFGETIVELAKKDSRIVAITAAMAKGTGLDRFREEFPGRFYDVGIAEQHAVTFAGGLAISGYRPVVAVYSTFLQRAFDQILHDICLQNLPVIFAVDRAGLVGEDGPTHHGVFDISFLSMMPNMTVLSPKDGKELRDMLYFAAKYNGPIAVRYPKGEGTAVDASAPVEKIQYGTGKIEREGTELAIFGVGEMVGVCLKAAEKLAEAGISATVVNPRFIKPVDENLVRSLAEEISYFVTVEEHVLAGGFGSTILEFLERNRVDNVHLLRIGIPDRFVDQGSRDELLREVGLTPESIAKKIESGFLAFVKSNSKFLR